MVAVENRQTRTNNQRGKIAISPQLKIQAHLLGPFADIPLERVLEGSVVVQLEEVCEGAEMVEEEAEGDETGDKVLQLNAGHPPEQADHVDGETIDDVGQISYFMSPFSFLVA